MAQEEGDVGMRFKGSIALFALAIIIGSAYFFYLLPAKRAAERERELKRRIFNTDEKEIEVISLSLEGRSYEMKREPGGWMITSPVRLMADEKIIKSIIDVLNAERIIKVVTTDMRRLGEFGLARPLIYAAFGHGGEVDEFYVGRPTPSSAAAYMYKKGLDGVFMVSVDTASALNHDLYGLRRKEPFLFEPGAVTVLEIDREGGALKFVRTQSGWDMSVPLKGRANSRLIEGLLEDMRTVRAEEFYDDAAGPDPAKYGRSVGITLSLNNGEKVRLDAYFWGTKANRGIVLYQRGLGYYARTNQRDLWNALQENVGIFKYRGLFEIKSENAIEIRWQKGGDIDVLRKEGSRWALNGEDVPSEEVDSLIRWLNMLEAYRVIEEGSFKGGDKSYSLEITGSGGRLLGGLDVYGETWGYPSPFDPKKEKQTITYYAISNSLGEKCLVTNFTMDDIDKKLSSLKPEVIR